jgi:hypothetical protein
MMTNRGKNNGAPNLISQSQRNSVFEHQKDIDLSLDNRQDAINIKNSLQQVSLKLGFDEPDRVANLVGGPDQAQVKQEIKSNMDIYKINKFKSYDSKCLF